ncbi:9079_t:CDS:2, partial [Scutellospora calospora]
FWIMGRNRHKWSKYFKIFDEFANKSNKAAICYACLEALELEKILQIENESSEESDEDSTKKIKQTVASGLPFKWIQDDDIIAAFKLANPSIQLPSRHKLSRSILNKEILVTNIENSINSDDKNFPSDIAKIINDSVFWNDLKELDEILLPFCATLNKLQCELARLYDIMHAYA